MKIKLLGNLTTSIEDKIAESEIYRTLNKKLLELQIELKKELSESGLKIYEKVDELEAELVSFSIEYACNDAFFEGIAFGQELEVYKNQSIEK